MAGEWIKFQTSTLKKPEILRIARMLGVRRNEALGLMVEFWIWLDNSSVDGHVDGIGSQEVDDMMSCPGLSGALQAVGWLVVDEANLRISVPNFGRHNGETAKKRALKNERQARWREKNVDSPTSTTASTREEKRRDKPIHTLRAAGKPSSLPADFSISERVRAWAAEKGYRRLEARLEHFVGYAKRSGKKYVDWDEAFMSAVREDWAKLGAQEPVRSDGVFRVAL